jgi:hypothetical protein
MPIAAQPHAAPAAGSLLARILKMEHAIGTLANSLRIGLGEQLRSRVSQWSQQVFGCLRPKPLLHEASRLACWPEAMKHWIRCHQPIQLVKDNDRDWVILF